MPDVFVGLDGFKSRASMGLNGKAPPFWFDDCPTLPPPAVLL
jgi:hypothetical protein